MGDDKEGTKGASSERSARAAFRIDAIASGFVGALALAVSTYNVYLQREQIRAQVWPHLEWTYSEDYSEANGRFAWQLENTGVGPAKIEAVQMTVDGKPVKSWSEGLELLAKTEPELRRMIDARDPPFSTTHSDISGFRVLGAGVSIHPLRINGAKQEHSDLLRRMYLKLRIDICYCSTLGECWTYRGQRPTRSCPTEGFTFED